MEWHVAVGTQRYIADSVKTIATWLREGRIGWNAYVYDHRAGRWVFASEIPELRQMYAGTWSPTASRWGCGLLVFMGVLLPVLSSFNQDRKRHEVELPATASSVGVAVNAPNADYDAGYQRGRFEGADHASSGAGMPIPLGMNWMADQVATAARPNDAESWKRGFKDGFVAGFTSVKGFHRNDSEWAQLSWRNVHVGTKLYDYDGTHQATIQQVDREGGLIVVRYTSGEVEPKQLTAVSAYWWVRKE